LKSSQLDFAARSQLIPKNESKRPVDAWRLRPDLA